MNQMGSVAGTHTTEGLLEHISGWKWLYVGGWYVELTIVGLIWLKVPAPFLIHIQKASLAWKLQVFAEKVCKLQCRIPWRPPGCSNSSLSVPSIPLGSVHIGPTRHPKSYTTGSQVFLHLESHFRDKSNRILYEACCIILACLHKPDLNEALFPLIGKSYTGFCPFLKSDVIGGGEVGREDDNGSAFLTVFF